ncbi:MAG TPA: response regulator [Methanoculleus sp.]|nr:response regulator [Methanoculleus sp.]
MEKKIRGDVSPAPLSIPIPGTCMPGASKTRLLVVDDDTSLLVIVRLSLERNGEFNVHVARSAPEALALLETQTFKAVVSDYAMQPVNGIEFHALLRAQDTSVPFILFTSMARGYFIPSLFDGVLTRYLSKEEGLADSCAALARALRCACNATGQGREET